MRYTNIYFFSAFFFKDVGTSTNCSSSIDDIINHNANFHWESSNPEILNEQGEVNRPSKDTEVTLTLYVELGKKEESKEFDFIIIGTGINENQHKVLEDGNDASIIIGRTLLFQDEFNGNNVDETKWLIQEGDGRDYGLDSGWGNNELQWYTKNNAKVSSGTLKIHLKQETMPYSKRYSSARLATLNTHGQTYGRIEARVRVTSGDGVWPAFWMMPKDSVYGSWPLSGEIDIFEAQGRIASVVTSALHHTSAGIMNSKSLNPLADGKTIRNYHVYAVEWQLNKIEFSVDGKVYHTVHRGMPFDKDFYIILNLAYGGKFDPRQNINPERDLPAIMEVDWVRAYEGLSA